MSFSWFDLKRPIVGLSAMDGVTDAAMREITRSIGSPDFMVTEFTSSDGLAYGVSKLLRDFYYVGNERPIIAQIFGSNPEKFYIASVICCYLGFDGIDINMGCPADSATKRGGGAALIQTPDLALDIVRHVKRGVKDWTNGITLQDAGVTPAFSELIARRIEHHQQQQFIPARWYEDRPALPVSVKTRVGYDKPVTKEWVSRLLEVEPAVITLHGRTLEQHYSGEASWEEIAKASDLVHLETNKTLLFGNGDLTTPEQITQRIKQSGVDGVWIARGAMGNPWIFSEYHEYCTQGFYTEPTWDERKKTLLAHCSLFEDYNKTIFADDPYPFLNMRKHMGWYVKGIPNASELRQKLFQTNSLQEIKDLLSAS